MGVIEMSCLFALHCGIVCVCAEVERARCFAWTLDRSMGGDNSGGESRDCGTKARAGTVGTMGERNRKKGSKN